MGNVTPNDILLRGKTDSESVQNAVRAAQNTAEKTVRIPKHNERTGEDIDTAILLPSDITVILDDCHLRLVDGVVDNIFRNEVMYTDRMGKADSEQHDIHIVGRGNAVLDGGKMNNLFENTMNLPENAGKHVRMNNLILLHNVRRYSLSGFRCVNMRYWAINQLFCSEGFLHHLSFFNGEHHRNQDGINFRIGCHDAVVEHISGRTGDDVVALSAFPVGGDIKLAVEGKSVDIHDMTVRHVSASTHQTVVALRNTDGAKLYNVTVEDVHGMVDGEYQPWGVVRIGENDYFRERNSVLGETHHITVRNVSSACKGTVFLAATLCDSLVEDVEAGGSAMHTVSTFFPTLKTESGNRAFGGVSLERVVFRNIRYRAVPGHCQSPYMTFPDRPYSGCALDFRCMHPENSICDTVFYDISGGDAPAVLTCDGLTLDIQ